MTEIAYSREFYTNLAEGSLRSAEVIVPLVLKLVQPSSVIDVGCGVGTWLRVCQDNGVEDVWGIDGSPIDATALLIPTERFVAADLTKPIQLGRSADLVLCMEVGEHLPASVAETFVFTLTSLAPVVLFSAAIPFQGGTNHLNEQWPAYWAALFCAQQYEALDCIRPKVWQNPAVIPCYAQNTILFAHRDVVSRHPQLQRELEFSPGGPLSLVHPQIYLGMVDPGRLSSRQALGNLVKVAKRRLLYRFRQHQLHPEREDILGED